MENQKVVNLLRSLADLLETNKPTVVGNNGRGTPNGDVLPQAIKDVMMGAKKNEQAKDAFGDGINSKTWAKMTTPISMTKSEEIQRTIDVMKRVDESGTIRAYKTKVGNQDTKISDYIKRIDELRLEAVIGLHDDSLEHENHNKEKVSTED